MALIITGPAGIGKTYIGSALAHALCCRDITVHLRETPQWLADLTAQSERRRLAKAFKALRRTQVIIFGEWIREPLPPQETRCPGFD